MTAPNSGRIFLAHAHHDRERVKRFANILKSCGLEAWLDEGEIHPGEGWRPTVDRAIRDSSTILIFLSEAALGSHHLINEDIPLALATAREQPEKLILPVRFDQSQIPAPLAHLNSIAASGLEELLEKLQAEVNPNPWVSQDSPASDAASGLEELLEKLKVESWAWSQTGRASDVRIVFDGKMEPAEINGVLTALSNYFRACGGIGLAVDFDLEKADVLEKADA